MSESPDINIGKTLGIAAAAPVYVPLLMFGFLLAIMGIFIPKS